MADLDYICPEFPITISEFYDTLASGSLVNDTNYVLSNLNNLYYSIIRTPNLDEIGFIRRSDNKVMIFKTNNLNSIFLNTGIDYNSTRFGWDKQFINNKLYIFINTTDTRFIVVDRDNVSTTVQFNTQMENSRSIYANGYIFIFGTSTSNPNVITVINTKNDTVSNIIGPATISPLLYLNDNIIYIISHESVGGKLTGPIYRFNSKTLLWEEEIPFKSDFRDTYDLGIHDFSEVILDNKILAFNNSGESIYNLDYNEYSLSTHASISNFIKNGTKFRVNTHQLSNGILLYDGRYFYKVKSRIGFGLPEDIPLHHYSSFLEDGFDINKFSMLDEVKQTLIENGFIRYEIFIVDKPKNIKNLKCINGFIFKPIINQSLNQVSIQNASDSLYKLKIEIKYIIRNSTNQVLSTVIKNEDIGVWYNTIIASKDNIIEIEYIKFNDSTTDKYLEKYIVGAVIGSLDGFIPDSIPTTDEEE
ncbi:MAG: hypothetical protein PHF63_00105 [Herbinix sp.]|nr:hypothetical protein [Herbinix sp.]